ncbi:hypothetical protein FRB95_004708 [Tulasnella sp. JGI-2019a]|nr:hypothetical protein FRB95_004708 [Tulasnella sp. JGI-2019a]
MEENFRNGKSPMNAVHKSGTGQSLAIPQLGFVEGAKEFNEVASILRAVRSTLSRLFVNFCNSFFCFTAGLPRLKAALLELSNIEEFCCAPDFNPHGPELWSLALFPEIKRLVVFYAPLGYLMDTIRSLLNLQTLISAYPYPNALEEDLIPFLWATDGLKSIMVVLGTHPDDYPEHLSVLMRRSGFRGDGSGFKMSLEGVLKAIQEGELWTHSE